MHVYLLATLDTKGEEAVYVRDELRALGAQVRVVDVSCGAGSSFEADVGRGEVFAAAGVELPALAAADRGWAVSRAAEGAARIVSEAHASGQLAGIIGLGGSAGTTIAAAAMQRLPLGVPKLLVSTLASGQVRQYVGDKDIMMLNPVVDLAGLNRVSRRVLTAAARAIAGMASAPLPSLASMRPLIAATMFGVTTPCVVEARRGMEAAGSEVLVFHATGSGGRAMEALVREGMFDGVLDLTTTELADELVGGFLSAGPDRLTAAARGGVPQVVSVGATDMVNFYAPSTVPARFRGRKLHTHNANVTLMRTTADECAQIGAEIGRKIVSAAATTIVLLPLRGVSDLDRDGGPFDDPQARRALFDALKTQAKGVEVRELDLHINDPQFGVAAASCLLELWQRKKEARERSSSTHSHGTRTTG